MVQNSRNKFLLFNYDVFNINFRDGKILIRSCDEF